MDESNIEQPEEAANHEDLGGGSLDDNAPIGDIQRPTNYGQLHVPKDSHQVRPQGMAPNPHNGASLVGADSPVAGYFNLYRWHPFTELFCLIAEWFDDQGKSDVEQRASFAREHSFLFRTAVFLDFVLLGLIVVAILAVIGFIALRTVGVEIQTIPIYLPSGKYE